MAVEAHKELRQFTLERWDSVSRIRETNLGNGGHAYIWLHTHRCAICKYHSSFWMEVAQLIQFNCLPSYCIR